MSAAMLRHHSATTLSPCPPLAGLGKKAERVIDRRRLFITANPQHAIDYAADFGVGVVRLPRFFCRACSMGTTFGERNHRYPP
jgi:hypothetical protein